MPKKTGPRTPRTTRQQYVFELEPMQGKPLTCITGVGPKTAAILEDFYILTADELFGSFLVLWRREDLFQRLFKDNETGISPHIVRKIHQAFSDWSHNFLD